MRLLDAIELDSSTYFSAGDFGYTLTHAGGTIQCLPSDEWLAVDGDFSATSTVQPTAWIHKADAPNLAVGDLVTITNPLTGIAKDYTIQDMQVDSQMTGEVLLVLSV